MVPVIVVHVAEPVMVQSGHLRFTPFFFSKSSGVGQRGFSLPAIRAVDPIHDRYGACIIIALA